MNKQLVILSDLWGASRCDWVDLFAQWVPSDYEVKFLDSCTLGDIDMQDLTESNIHKQFVDFGIDRATQSLIDLKLENATFIGCSVGGTIAWKAAMQGLSMQKLITISATRIRYELTKPQCDTSAYFGSLDRYKPDAEWYDMIGLKPHEFTNRGHDIYNTESIIKQIINTELG